MKHYHCSVCGKVDRNIPANAVVPPRTFIACATCIETPNPCLLAMFPDDSTDMGAIIQARSSGGPLGKGMPMWFQIVPRV